MRHKWINKHRTVGAWHATCARCGLERDQRFAYDTHWTEYRRPTGKWFISAKTPPCEPNDRKTIDNSLDGLGAP